MSEYLPNHDNIWFLGRGRFGWGPGGCRRSCCGGRGGRGRSVRDEFLLILIATDPLDVYAGLDAVANIHVGIFAVDVVRPVANEVVGVENGAGATRHFEEAAVGALNELGALVGVRPNA